MKSYFIHFSFLLFIFIGTQSLHAQHYVNLAGFFAQPYGAFDDYRAGGGLSVDIISKEALPQFIFNFQYGAHADFLFSGGESFNANFPFGNNKIQVSNQSFGTHVFGRITTIKAGIRFYGDVLVGSRLFYSTLTTFSDNEWENEEDDTDWLMGKLTAYYGVSGGLQLRLAPKVYLDGKITQTFGSSARFVDLSSLDYSNGYLDYATQRTDYTDMFHVQLGVTFQVGDDNRTKLPKKQKKAKPHKKPIIDRPGPEPLPKS